MSDRGVSGSAGSCGITAFLEALHRLLIEDEVEKTHMFIDYLARLVFNGHPCQLGVEPVVVVFQRVKLVHLNSIIGLGFVKSLLEFVLPTVGRYHIEKLLNDGLMFGRCHLRYNL